MMMGLKVLVTGAGGYIGRFVVKSLLALGNEVVALDFALDGIDTRADARAIDIFKEKDGLYERLGRPDVMIHMAWREGFKHNSDAHMLFLSDHYAFITAMVAQGLKQVVVMGSMHEVGYFEGEIGDETPENPQSLYGISKSSLRRALMLRLGDIEGVVLQWVRAYYILGDDERNASVFSKIIQAAKAGKKNFPFSNGLNEYDFIDIKTLGEQIAKVACQKKVTGVINCCSGRPQRLKDVVERFISENKLDIELQFGAFPDRPYDSPRVYGNPEKINRIMAMYP